MKELIDVVRYNKKLLYAVVQEQGDVEDTWKILHKDKVVVGIIDWRDGKFSTYQLVDRAYRFYELDMADRKQVRVWLSQTLDAFEAQQSDKK